MQLVGAVSAAVQLLSLALTAGAIAPPVWPDAYQVSYVFSLPYMQFVQQSPLRYNVTAHYDKLGKRLHTATYNGLDETFALPDATYMVFPRIHVRACTIMGLHQASGPTRRRGRSLQAARKAKAPLPDLATWQFAGTSRLPGRPPSHIWQRSDLQLGVVNAYTFHVTQDDGRPLRLSMMGINLFSGSHYDQYEVDFTGFHTLQGNLDALFRVPEVCRSPVALADDKHNTALAALDSLLPASRVPDPAAPASQQPLPSHDDLRYIAAWNARVHQARRGLGAVARTAPGAPVAPADLYTLAPNHMSTWDDARWQAASQGLLRTRRRRSLHRSMLAPAHSFGRLGVYKRVLRDDQLRPAVDWRGTGADGPVKDQAACGSCWAFAVTGALTGAWWKATGQALSFSEQQIMDCGWDHELNGCWGGEVQPALRYVADAGGIALTASYPYRGQPGYCKANSTAMAAKFKGFMTVPNDEKAVMEVLMLHGPLAVSFEASHKSFKFYSGGVYYREDCGRTYSELTHSSVLVGYGTTPDGTDYWILKNSWSAYYGEAGYIRMARKGNDCGITVDAVMAVVDDAAAAAAKAA